MIFTYLSSGASLLVFAIVIIQDMRKEKVQFFLDLGNRGFWKENTKRVKNKC